MITFANMEKLKGINNRRTFIRIGMVGIFTFLVIAWNKLTLNTIQKNKRKQQVLTVENNKGVSFLNEYIVVRQNDKLSVLSAHCTHLGCKINKAENGRLVCPCHGSEYDLEGNVLKGPAYKSLKKEAFKLSADGTRIEIES